MAEKWADCPEGIQPLLIEHRNDDAIPTDIAVLLGAYGLGPVKGERSDKGTAEWPVDNDPDDRWYFAPDVRGFLNEKATELGTT